MCRASVLLILCHFHHHIINQYHYFYSLIFFYNLQLFGSLISLITNIRIISLNEILDVLCFVYFVLQDFCDGGTLHDQIVNAMEVCLFRKLIKYAKITYSQVKTALLIEVLLLWWAGLSIRVVPVTLSSFYVTGEVVDC